MAREITNHTEILKALASAEIISELVEKEEGHFKYELDLEVCVYGRNYTGKKVGPYIRYSVYEQDEPVIRQGDWGGNAFYILVEGVLDVYINNEKTGQPNKVGELQPGTGFGEMAMLTGLMRNATVTVPTGSEAKVLEVQRPSLRLLRKLPRFGHRLDVIYRKHGLDRMLEDIKQETKGAFTPELLKQLGSAARFWIYGKRHVLFHQGDPINRLIFVNTGWIRRVRGVSFNAEMIDMVMHKDESVDFLGAGNCLGLEGLAGEKKWAYTATVLARTEVLEISLPYLRQHPELMEAVMQSFSKFSTVDDDVRLETFRDSRVIVATEKEIGTGVVDGMNLLVMDMDLCIRCGNCSLACHKIHGQSRLLRRGIHIERPVKPQSASTQHVLMPSVCLHCQDPECLTGCPTGAIGRFANGQIDINPKTCIGCSDCATQCPYNAITMVSRKASTPAAKGLNTSLLNWLSLAPQKMPAPETETENLLAVKCNLCNNTPLNPQGKSTQKYSCEESCPTGALVRVNPREYFNEAKNTIGLIYRDQTHAIGRNIHKRDTPALLWHIFGALATIALTVATIWGIKKYSYDLSLGGTWWTVRWITGLVGLGGIAGVMTYPARKQIYRRRSGPLRYWMLFHVYLGLIAGIVLLLHGGHNSGGLLTTLLMIAFDLVIVSGLFGIACYLVVPRIMTGIEEDPLLIEDLRERRDELRETLANIGLKSNDQLRDLIKRKVRPRFLTMTYLVRQYVRREKLTTMLAQERERFETDVSALTDPKAQSLLIEAVESTATLRRVDALIYLHQLLKLWLAPHVVSTALMLALMLVHIIQVIFFKVR